MIRDVASFVPDWLAKRASLSPERIAVIDTIENRELTFVEWNQQVNQVAHFLCHLGLKKGDRISVYAENCLDYLNLLFACNKTGVIQHNLNWRLAVPELEGILRDALPRVVFYGGTWCEQVRELQRRVEFVEAWIAIDEKARPADMQLSQSLAYPQSFQRTVDLVPSDPWAIFYTGGTTGLPKGAVLTYDNMTWNSVNTIVSWGLTADCAAPLQLPLFHIGGPNIFMLPLVHVGGKTVLCRGFDVEQTFDLLESGTITHYVGVPTMFIMLQQHPRWAGAAFSHLKLVISGGAPCPLPVMERFWAKGVKFRLGYGLTEAAGNNFWLPDADVRRKPGSVGFPLFHIDMQIVHPDGRPCGPDEAGELLIRGPHITAGYWNRPDETREMLRDGWLHTGDLARRDEEGYYYIIGRSKDMFISGGENVYPAEIESVLHGHPDVAEAAVIGVPHDKWGEVGCAFVVPVEGRELSERDLRRYLESRLARYKIPHEFHVLSALPKTAIGKVDKKALRERRLA